MSEKIVYGGRNYYLQSSGKYFQSGTKGDVERLLHRRVWHDKNGPIPDGHAVHHKDGDWRNNHPDNLEIMPIVEHARHHMVERNSTPEGMAKTLSALATAITKAPAWHKSEEGRAWHKAHAARTFAVRPTVIVTCERCAKSYETRDPHTSRFCSSSCRQRAGMPRYKTLSKKCEACGVEYVTSRHRPTRFCGYVCSNGSRGR